MYHSTNFNEFISYFNEYLSNLNKENKEVYITGDFNIDLNMKATQYIKNSII